MTHATLSNADLVRAMAKAARHYPSRECRELTAEAQRRGRPAVESGAAEVAAAEDAKDRATLAQERQQ